jgi:hypothetical protein|tara:strand:- start:357 stop:635 length:279 start_codon:yes stop_codon:yes gene_type:complete
VGRLPFINPTIHDLSTHRLKGNNMKKYKVICIDPRQIADDVYAINQEYIVEETRLNKYKHSFKIVEEIVDKPKVTKKAAPITNKDAGKTEDK